MCLFCLDTKVNKAELLKKMLTVWSKCVHHGLWMGLQMRNYPKWSSIVVKDS